MATGQRVIYIAGAGIAGLTLALSLAKRGFAAVVLEREAQPNPLGAGIQLSPNARRVLDRLGLDAALRAASFSPEFIDLYPFASKAPLKSLQYGKVAERRYGAAYSVLHRAELAGALLTAARRSSNIEIVWAVRQVDLVRHARGLSIGVELMDRSAINARPYAYVGADGVGSRTRTELLGGKSARYSGFVAWRALAGEAQLAGLLPIDRVSVFWGRGFHAVTYPLPGRREINVVLVTKVSEKRAFGEKQASEPKIDSYYRGRSHVFGELLRVLRGKWTFWPISTVEASKWHDDSVGIIGDAAHAMLPFAAQGAAMAIEDGALLAREMIDRDSPEEAFQSFAAHRRGRIDKVRRLARRNGAAFHLPWPMSLIRNRVVAAQSPDAHLAESDWLYRYDPLHE